jgi:hypothetical protein
VPPSHPALFPPFCSLPVYLHQVCNWSGLDNACSMVPLQRFATFGLNFWMFTIHMSSFLQHTWINFSIQILLSVASFTLKLNIIGLRFWLI